MVYKFVPQYANNVQGLVYMGAACLIIIVGLRGIGKVAASIAIVPKFLLGLDGKVAPMWVMAALFLEGSTLCNQGTGDALAGRSIQLSGRGDADRSPPGIDLSFHPEPFDLM